VTVTQVVGGEGFVVIDVETTGLSPNTDRILELAVVRTDVRGHVTSEWSSRFNPQGPVGATHIHGITEADVRHAPLFTDRIDEIVSQLEGAAVVAHNARFDTAFLRGEFARAGWQMPWLPTLCTLEASRQYLPDLDRRRLPDCCHAARVRLTDAHSALGDARATADLLAYYLDPNTPPAPLAGHLDLAHEGAAVVWPHGPSAEPLTPPTERPKTRSQYRTPVKVSPSLLSMLADYSLQDALDEGAPDGAAGYLELLMEVLEDGIVTDDESGALADTVVIYGLSEHDVEDAHRGFLLALAHKAVEDGRITRAEREELSTICTLLGLPSSVVQDVLNQAEQAGRTVASEGLKNLPDDWNLGEPLRVGDRVVFTGCDPDQRSSLERRAQQHGVRVISSVSGKTTMLVTDGSYDGNKATEARRLGTRVGHPDDFDTLLNFLQPALPPAPKKTSTARASVDRPAQASTQSGAEGLNPSVVRKWAIENGYSVGTRGRIHADVYAAFVNANEETELA
jgi:DNA polymerase-3 subunit epsilon